MNPWWILGGLAVVAFLVWLARWALGEPLTSEPLPAVQDDLEAIWNLPAYDPDGTAGYERLDQVIRDHREEES